MISVEQWTSLSVKDSVSVAKKLADIFKPADIVLMQGNLGSGKTFIVQHICKVWQVDEQVTSPTFTILQHYSGKYNVNHFDFYRIKSVKELDQLGWEEFFYSNAVTFVEWPQIIENVIDTYYKIIIENHSDKRKISLFSK